MKRFNKIMLLLLFGVVICTQSVQAQTIPVIADATRESSRLAFSPYAQAVPNDSYTFIGVSHPSLDTALTQIGVALEVIDMTTTLNTTAGRVSIFTVDAGETHRIFVVNQSHSTINSSNSAFTDARTHLINTVDSAQFGSVRLTSVSNRPANAAGLKDVTVGTTKKFDNLAQLNIWGIVFVESSGTGFAMEFIGDAQDSTLGGGGTVNSTLGNPAFGGGATVRPGRGVN
ncbi:MAG: hypothetical protein HOK41_02035 [Nitrospina sp.]|jgi:hypothetical protein|nr:hypothetical protein [Nitrospina sp.]